MAIQSYGYLRVSGCGQIATKSGKREDEKDGLQRQRRAVVDFVKGRGIEVVEWHQEVYTGTEADRPVFASMLGSMMANGVKVVIVESLDRFARDLLIQSTLLAKLASEGITLIAANTGEDVTAAMEADPMRKALVQIQGVFAELDKSMLMARLHKGKEAKRARGGRCEGPPPFGELDGEDEVLVEIRRLRRKPRQGKRLSYGRIAKMFNANEVPTRKGGPWQRETIRVICERHRWL